MVYIGIIDFVVVVAVVVSFCAAFLLTFSILQTPFKTLWIVDFPYSTYTLNSNQR